MAKVTKKIKRKAPAALTRKLTLSDKLAIFMGKSKASRGECVKEIWRHIKAEGLNEGRTIYPDAHLAPILGKSKLTMFDVAKKLSSHILKD